MKICPVCSARCFDDMEVCYGCLHTFTNEFGADYAKEEDDGGFGEFEPEPASDWLVRQETGQSPVRSLPEILLSEMRAKSECFTAQFDINCTNDENIDVSIRIPLEAIRMLKRV